MKYFGSRDDFMGNYPAGAAHDPRAPWNQEEPEERTFNVDVCYTIGRTADVTTTEYDFHSDGVEMLQPKDDYEDTYLTPVQIIDFAREAAEYLLTKRNTDLGSKFRLRRIIDSCQGWDIKDWDVEQT